MTQTADAPAAGRRDRTTGLATILLTFLVILREWDVADWAGPASAATAAVLIGLLAVQVRWGRVVFVLVGLALVAMDVATRADWLFELDQALQRAAFIGAFFTALATLRHVADTSPAIRECGRFLAQQPPGRRYAALTVGGQLFALLLNYGAIVLLGSMAVANASEEANEEVRFHRTRRMLLAIQRAFISTLPWSPLSFAIAITTALIPGATWAGVLLPCLGTGIILAATGWALDTIFKPKLKGPRPAPRKPDGSWALLLPLLGLLALLGALVAVLNLSTGVRIIGVVLVVVPTISLVWLLLQGAPGGRAAHAGESLKRYVLVEMPGYRGELVLLMMAGFIGALGSVLLVPLIQAAGVDLATVPAWLMLPLFVWILPILGQIGMNPILAVSLLAPALPTPEEMGVSTVDLVVAITAGWALSGANSPFTATTLLTGRFGGVSARHVGLVWNRAYNLVAAALLTLWVLVFVLI